MKAVQINRYGGTDVLEVNDNVPSPAPKDGQILVKVHAAGLNPFDSAIRSGMLKDNVPLTFPIRMGGDFAGVVNKTGEAVFGTAIVLGGGSGSFSETAAANTANCAAKPKKASFEEAAALPVVGCSVVQALEEYMKLQKGQKILIHGGAGGIGHLAIQLAKSIGAYVATTVSGNDSDFVKGFGADEAIDYKTQKFEQILRDFDAVYDTVGGETTNTSFQVLKKGGILLSMLGQPSEALAGKFGVKAVGMSTKTDRVHLSRVAELVDNGSMKVHIDRVFPLEQVKDAFTHLETGHPRGKVVLKIK